MINILIVDDHPIVRAGLSSLIMQVGKGKYKIVGQVGSLNDALRAVRDLKPDMLIVDISLNGSDGIELIKCIRSQKDNDRMRILVLSVHDESLYAERSIHAGADGYIMKHEGASEISTAVDTVSKGDVYLSNKIATQLLRAKKGKSDRDTMLVDTLADRELEVLGLLGSGLTTHEVSDALHLSMKTVETYCARIREKMGLRNYNQLIFYAVEWTHHSHDQ